MNFRRESTSPRKLINIKGKAIVFTGRILNMSRKEAHTWVIAAKGASYGIHVTASTDYVICGECSRLTYKQRRARDLGVPIIKLKDIA